MHVRFSGQKNKLIRNFINQIFKAFQNKKLLKYTLCVENLWIYKNLKIIGKCTCGALINVLILWHRFTKKRRYLTSVIQWSCYGHSHKIGSLSLLICKRTGMKIRKRNLNPKIQGKNMMKRIILLKIIEWDQMLANHTEDTCIIAWSSFLIQFVKNGLIIFQNHNFRLWQY